MGQSVRRCKTRCEMSASLIPWWVGVRAADPDQQTGKYDRSSHLAAATSRTGCDESIVREHKNEAINEDIGESSAGSAQLGAHRALHVRFGMPFEIFSDVFGEERSTKVGP